ncbi:response regulator transcription factor [Epibacterium ulvae]|uniref:helix-turn-helix transcriptional regulator n=1 Tax=Epibacterium ulvae TaxID=1156985 RepID=UPI001BFC8394|nr:response regulator transcription factor [Epibacterium ulvae]MBT8153669.1 response regulator transcription factor [Epibacterium ulvae]
MPEIVNMEPLASGTHQQLKSNCDTAVFIGPKKSFSNTVLRNVEAELEEIEPLRYDAVSDFVDIASVTMVPARLIVIDASILDEERSQFHRLLNERETLLTGPEAPGIVLAYMHDSCVQKVFAAVGRVDGFQGVLPMNQSIDIWLAVMRLLLSGGTYFPADVLDKKLTDQQCENEALAGARRSLTDKLTQREIAVMEHVMHGLQNKQIAEKLKVSEHTIKLHIHHVITKLKVTNRTAAAMKFVEVMQH